MIGLCLKCEQRNYGSKLQALATLKIFEDLGFEYRILKYLKKDRFFKIKSLPRVFNIVFLNDRYDSLQKTYSFKTHPEVAKNINRRNALFAKYDEKHFNKYFIQIETYEALKTEVCNYTSIVTCSDQLWSPAALGTNFYNLMFVPDNINKVSFASSFGVSKIPWYQVKRTKRYLNRIEYISVRENQGRTIIKELIGRDVPVLMDPVFYYTMEEWNGIVPVKAVDLPPYILCYFLGNNKKYREIVSDLSKKTGLKIVTLPHLDRYVPEDEHIADYALFDVGPEDFLNLIRCAEIVCTDSFHGCAFSIINEKNFFVFNRYSDSSSNSKNSRIDTICRNLGLEDRRVTSDADLLLKMKQTIDYGLVKEKLSSYINKMKTYLHESVV